MPESFIEVFRCTVPGQPTGKGSVRVATRDRKGNALPFAKRYFPKKTEEWADLAAMTFASKRRTEYGGRTLQPDAYAREVVAVMERPKALAPKYDKRTGLPTPKSPPTTRMRAPCLPDDDNILKQLDALKAAMVIADDRYFCRTIIDKWYAAEGEEPHLEGVLYRIEGTP